MKINRIVVLTLLLAAALLAGGCSRTLSPTPTKKAPVQPTAAPVEITEAPAGVPSPVPAQPTEAAPAQPTQAAPTQPAPAQPTQAAPTQAAPAQPTQAPAQPAAPTQPTEKGGQVVAPAAPAAPAAVVRPTSYKLKRGEFPFCIARRFDVDPNQLLAMNGLMGWQYGYGGPGWYYDPANGWTGNNAQYGWQLTKKNGWRYYGVGGPVYSYGNGYQVYYPGLELQIPQEGSFPYARALNPHPAQYTVAPWDNIYSIACVFGDVDPTAIAQANNLQAPYQLEPGQVLNIP